LPQLRKKGAGGTPGLVESLNRQNQSIVFIGSGPAEPQVDQPTDRLGAKRPTGTCSRATTRHHRGSSIADLNIAMAVAIRLTPVGENQDVAVSGLRPGRRDGRRGSRLSGFYSILQPL
jgi:hypothetical protein